MGWYVFVIGRNGYMVADSSLVKAFLEFFLFAVALIVPPLIGAIINGE